MDNPGKTLDEELQKQVDTVKTLLPKWQQDVRTFALSFVIIIFIGVLWRYMEIKFHGKATPSIEDSIITIILGLSIYFNIRYFYRYFSIYKTAITLSYTLIKLYTPLITQLEDLLKREEEAELKQEVLLNQLKKMEAEYDSTKDVKRN